MVLGHRVWQKGMPLAQRGRLRCRYCGDVCVMFRPGIGSCYDCGTAAWLSTDVVHPDLVWAVTDALLAEGWRVPEQSKRRVE